MTREQMIDEAVRAALRKQGSKVSIWLMDVREGDPFADNIRTEFRRIAEQRAAGDGQ